MNNYLTAYTPRALEEAFSECKPESRVFWLLMQCVVASANNMVYRDTQAVPKCPSWHADESRCAYWCIQRYGLYASRKLGRILRKSDIDITAMGLWEMLDDAYRSECLRERNRGRRVHIDKPSFMDICEAIEVENTLISPHLTLIAGGAEEGTDDYGLPAWYTRWNVLRPDLPTITLIEDSLSIAKRVFEMVHGEAPSKTDLKKAAEHVSFSYWFSHPYDRGYDFLSDLGDDE